MEKLSFYGVDPSLDVRERLVKAGGEEAGLKFDESTKIEVLNRRALGKQLLEGPSAAYPWSKRCCNCHEVLVSGAYQDRFPTEEALPFCLFLCTTCANRKNDSAKSFRNFEARLAIDPTATQRKPHGSHNICEFHSNERMLGGALGEAKRYADGLGRGGSGFRDTGGYHLCILCGGRQYTWMKQGKPGRAPLFQMRLEIMDAKHGKDPDVSLIKSTDIGSRTGNRVRVYEDWTVTDQVVVARQDMGKQSTLWVRVRREEVKELLNDNDEIE